MHRAQKRRVMVRCLIMIGSMGGEGREGGGRLTHICAEKGTKCDLFLDCFSIVNCFYRVATVLPRRSKGGAGCICGVRRIARHLGAEVQRCFHGYTTPPKYIIEVSGNFCGGGDLNNF